MYGYIYKITNKINGKIYVGLTKATVQRRWYQHCYRAKQNDKHGSIIDTAIAKYGKENFIVECLDTADSHEELNEKEQYWIKQLNAVENGYNILPGGGQPSPKSQSKEANEKRSMSLKLAYQTGKRKSTKGIKRSAEDCRKISEGQKGRIHSDETRLKMSLAQKGRPANHVVTEEERLKRSNSLKKAYAEGRRKPNGKGVGGRKKRKV